MYSYTIVYKQIKHLRLKVKEDGKLVVSAPVGVSKSRIDTFIKSKSSWIDKTVKRVIQKPDLAVQNWHSQKYIQLFGDRFDIIVTQNSEPIVVKTIDNTIEISQHASSGVIQHAFDLYAKKHVYIVSNKLINVWQKQIGVNTTRVRIRKMKTRWGVCNTKTKVITINSNLIHFDPVCVEYIVIHELVHLLEASHNQRFKSLMTKFLPHWKSVDSLLKNKYN